MVGLREALAAAGGVMAATGWMLIRPYWKSISLPRLLTFTIGALALIHFMGSTQPIRERGPCSRIRDRPTDDRHLRRQEDVPGHRNVGAR